MSNMKLQIVENVVLFDKAPVVATDFGQTTARGTAQLIQIVQ